jgi:hypothetical protein
VHVALDPQHLLLGLQLVVEDHVGVRLRLVELVAFRGDRVQVVDSVSLFTAQRLPTRAPTTRGTYMQLRWLITTGSLDTGVLRKRALQLDERRWPGRRRRCATTICCTGRCPELSFAQIGSRPCESADWPARPRQRTCPLDRAGAAALRGDAATCRVDAVRARSLRASPWAT